MKAPIIVAAVVALAGMSGCRGGTAHRTTPTNPGPTATVGTAPAATTIDGDPCPPADGTPDPCLPGDRRNPADGTAPDRADASGGPTTTLPVRCRASDQARGGEEALIALTTTQLEAVKANTSLPAETKRILEARYQQMLDDASSLRDAYARQSRDPCG
jgi:hypothetical protein